MHVEPTSIQDLLVLRPNRHLDARGFFSETWNRERWLDIHWRQLFIPRGFLHGYLTLEPDTEVQYKVDNASAPESEGAVVWDDPELAIDWPITTAPVLSARDAAAQAFRAWETPFELGHSP